MFANYSVELNPVINLSGSNYYTFRIKKNGNAVSTIDAQGNVKGGANTADFEPGDILTVTLQGYGTIPSPQPNYYLLKMIIDQYENC